MSATRSTTIEGPFQIEPSDIAFDEPLMGAFDQMEAEVSAGWIVRFCQHRGGWVAFSHEEIEAFYQETFPDESFRFSRLLGPRKIWVVEGGDEKLRVTVDFIARCFAAAPKLRSAAR